MVKEIPVSEKVETLYYTQWSEDRLLCMAYVKNLDMNLEIAKYCVSKRIEFSRGISYPCLIDMTGIRSATKEARAYMAKEGAMLITACALIIKSPLSRILGNLFLVIDKPAVPVKLFTDYKEARKWLKQYN